MLSRIARIAETCRNSTALAARIGSDQFLQRQAHALGNRDGRRQGAFIFITGDRASVSDSEADVPVLAKPFTAADLEAAIAQTGVDARA